MPTVLLQGSSQFGIFIHAYSHSYALLNVVVTEESHLAVLRLLESNPHMSQRDLAQATGVSLGKINYCLKALLGKGLIKMQNFRNSNNKLAYAYLLTPAGISAKTDLTTMFLKRKIAEYEALKNEIEQLKDEIKDADDGLDVAAGDM